MSNKYYTIEDSLNYTIYKFKWQGVALDPDSYKTASMPGDMGLVVTARAKGTDRLVVTTIKLKKGV